MQLGITKKEVVTGSARSLIATFDVKKRAYFGNTSMEAEISLLMANQTLVRPAQIVATRNRDSALLQAAPGTLLYDPFMGTGSMAYVSIRRAPMH